MGRDQVQGKGSEHGQIERLVDEPVGRQPLRPAKRA